MAGLTVRPASPPGDIEQYIRFPFALYQGFPHWVPPLLGERRDFLNPRKNPVYEYAEVQPLVAAPGATVVGTITRSRTHASASFIRTSVTSASSDCTSASAMRSVPRAVHRCRDSSRRADCRSCGSRRPHTNDVMGLLVEGFDEDPRF